jgi:hypothetical protein
VSGLYTIVFSDRHGDKQEDVNQPVSAVLFWLANAEEGTEDTHDLVIAVQDGEM